MSFGFGSSISFFCRLVLLRGCLLLIFFFGFIFYFRFVCGGRSGGFISFLGVIFIIISASFLKRVKIYIIIIIIWLAFLTYGNELDDLLGKGFFNNFSQWLT